MTATLKWPGHLGKMALILCDLSPAERCPGGQGYLLFQVCVHISSLRMLGLRVQQDIVSASCRERGSRGCVGQAQPPVSYQTQNVSALS